MLHAICPKCGSGSAWIEYNQSDTLLRCLCGLYALLHTTLGKIMIDPNGRVQDVRLPRQGTKLWECLLGVYVIAPANTQEITAQVNLRRQKIPHGKSLFLYDTNEVSSHLTVLRYKGLVVVTQFRKGLPGGSTWTLTPAATDLLATAVLQVKDDHGAHHRLSSR